MATGHWLVKSEPSSYSWDDFVKEGRTYWDGVRNHQARNNLAGMKPDDLVLFYHSVKSKEVVGIARVVRDAYPDPTTDDPRWLVVDLVPVKPFARPVTLAEIKAEPTLAKIKLVTHSRLSVAPLGAAEFRRILKLGRTTL